MNAPTLPSRLAAITTVFLTFLASGPSARGQNTTLFLENDPALGNPRPDDLYTSSLAVETELGRGRLSVGERMFTDRERLLRFDETFLEYTSPRFDLRGWNGEMSAGVMRVGRGFIGESGQNIFHDWIGSDRVVLPYVEKAATFGTAELRARRSLGTAAGAETVAEIEIFAAPSFRQWARATVAAEWPVGPELSVRTGLGARLDRADPAYFADRIDASGFTAELAVEWRSVVLRWAHNDHGTASPNVSLAYRPQVGFQRQPRVQ